MSFLYTQISTSIIPTVRSMIGGMRNSLLPAMPLAWQRRSPPRRGLVFDVEGVHLRSSRPRPAGFSIQYFEPVPSRSRQLPLAGLPRRWARFESHNQTHTDPLFVATLCEAHVSGRFPAVTSADGALFADVSRVHSEAVDTHPVYTRIRLPRPTRLVGKTLLLSSAWAGSFYHWIVDQLPRLALIARAGLDLRSFDHVLLPEKNGHFLGETLLLFPDLRAQRHTLSDHTHFECDELVCPSLPHRVGESDPWGPTFVAEHVLGGARRETGDRRFLISRGGAPRRRLRNEDDLWEKLLIPRGFERLRLEEHSIQEQAGLLATAAVVVAPHGAGLTNLVFAPKQCCVVELLNGNYPATCFWHLSDELGLDYRYVVGQPEISENAHAGAGQQSGFWIEPDAMADCLKDVPGM